MLNDRDEKYDGEDDNEYHFSDEEVNYEVESEPVTELASKEESETVFSRFARSKRMMISLVVFLILVFIVYKMLVPSVSAPPPTDINNTSVITAQPKPLSPPPVSAESTRPNVATYPSATTATPLPPATTVPMAAVVSPPHTVPNTIPSSQPVAGVTHVQQVPSVASSAPTTMPVTLPTPPPTTMQPSLPAPPSSPSTVASMPAVIPVQSPAPPYPPSVDQTLDNNSMQAKLAVMSAENEKLVSQLQAEYIQKISEFATQNKTLQEEMRLLNMRVATMETEITQLVQAMTRQGQEETAVLSSERPTNKAAYTVQAIIPGRAWLKADNGDTLTVAEGDVIRGLGKVVKIDPYDGVVNINTGNKVVSLSYGSSGG
jgi:hypothetical protein